jgi:rhodanese-related sulfurtransferase
MVKRSVDVLLDQARARIERVSPAVALRRRSEGALLVDIRPKAQRVEHGEVPHALIVERNVLEWRFDPQSAWHLPEVDGYEREVIVLCQEGYASSFAAETLRQLGHQRVADVIGGFAAWRSAGLPVEPS